MVVGILAALVLGLTVEKSLLKSRRRRIPLRIGITGTRGKSSVARLIAGALREGGRSVLGRTTGSRPMLMFPDGSEELIRRKGHASILEGKKLLKKARRLGVDCLVSELMSIHPECLYTESVQMLEPHVLVLTNVRVDHVAQMGGTPKQVARSLASAIPKNATVFLPQEEVSAVWEEAARIMGSRLVPVRAGSVEESRRVREAKLPLAFEANVRLALAVAKFCGIEPEAALRGMEAATADFGALQVWAAELGSPVDRWYLVSAFAANDPQSTRVALAKVRESLDWSGMAWTGLLNLRSDRADRTLQWAVALQEEPFSNFHRIYLLGGHARALRSRLPDGGTRWHVLEETDPARIMATITRALPGGSVLVGMGNMGGAGSELVCYWERIGRAS